MRNKTVGEWQEERNIWGGVRRYRMVDEKTKEYELILHTADGATISQSQIDEYNRRNAVAQRGSVSEQPSRECPFRSNAIDTKCLPECAFYTIEGCALAASDISDTKDRRCPIAAKNCTDRCALYANGCAIIQNIIRKEQTND